MGTPLVEKESITKESTRPDACNLIAFGEWKCPLRKEAPMPCEWFSYFEMEVPCTRPFFNVRVLYAPSTRPVRALYAPILYMGLLLCFGAGVLLATALTHMLPEVREHVSELVQDPEVWPPLKTIPLTEILLALGFFLVYGLDELVHMVLYRRQHSHLQHDQVKDEHHGHGHSHCPPATLTEREPRASTQNSLLRQSAGQHHYGTTECHGNHDALQIKINSENTPLLSTENNSSMSVTTGLLALVALSIHAVTEGLAIGLQESPSNVFFLLGAVATHKFVIAFCLGMELSSGWGETQVSLKFHTIYMTVFAGMSALGILLGLLLMDTAPGGLLIQALQAVAAGTLLYVTFCEVLPRERVKCHAGLAQFLAVLMGFSMLLVLDTFVPHEDENLPVNITMVLGNNSSM